MIIRILAFAVAAWLFPWSAFSHVATPPTLRLPDSVHPRRYAVELTIVPSEDSFRGSIDIELEVRKPTNILWLNARYLTVELARLEGASQTLQARVIPGGEDFVGLQFDPALAPGAARLHLEYRGEINKKDTSGIFSQREGPDWYAYTQFEPTRARRAFPCFDEPGFKVPWQLNLIVREQHIAISNTPVASQTTLPGGMKRVTFAQTQPLPSYLIAFGVGPFDTVDAGQAGMKATPVRIVTPKGMAAQARYAASITPRILELSEQYSGVPYPYEKLDSLAIPQTVSFGAMENPGLITYSMSLLLARPQDETPRFRQTYAQVAAHEIGHMWFGDLVTHAWWDDIWLNESFATWFAGKITDRFEPTWGVKIRSVIRRGEAMSNDGLPSARRIRQPIEGNSDIANAFDSITYTKGGAVLAMFEAWMGEDRFRNAVKRYLARHAHANATAADFLAELSAEDAQAGPAFATFLEQAGVPQVSMQLQCDKSGAKLKLSQQRFLPLGSAAANTQLWQVPVCVGYKAGGRAQRTCGLMKTGTEELALGAACPGSLAADTARYYRVRYDGALLGKIAVPKGPAETVALIGDISALAHNGTISLSQALRTVQPHAASRNRHVAQSLMTMIEGIRNLVPEALRPAEARWIRGLFGRQAHSLGLNSMPDEGEDARQLRPALLKFVVDAGDDRKLGAQSVALAKRWFVDRSAIDGSMVPTVLESAARHGDRGLFEQFRSELQKTQDRRERRFLLAALGSFRDAALAQAALDLLLDRELDAREAVLIAWTVSDDPQRGLLAFEFMKRNFDALVERLPRDAAAQFPKWGNQLCDQSARNDMEAFFRERIGKFTGGPRILAQTAETISLCAAFKSSQQGSLVEFLQRSKH
jgi:alanyl aminopeptidase